MAADPLLHVVVKLQDTKDLLCYLKAATLASQVFKTYKIKASVPRRHIAGCHRHGHSRGWHCASSWYLLFHSS